MSLTYEQKLDRDVNWALMEGSMHFESESHVHKALRTIAARLDALGIAYAIVGGMAMFMHGYRRFTEDVDIVVTADDLQRIHEQLEGLGYVRPAGSSRNLRDVATGVRIEFLVTGQYPGDGRPKPVAFPDPREAAVTIAGIRCVNLPRLIEMKLASGTTTNRFKDLGDVQELIRVLKLPLDLAGQIDASVRPHYIELWNGIHQSEEQERGQ